MRIWCLLFCSLLLASCVKQPPRQEGVAVGNKYAERFEIRDAGNCRVVSVRNPWQNSDGIEYSYVLGQEKELVPDSLEAFPFIRTPVKRVIAMSTTHLAMISKLDEISSIKGLSGGDYVYHQEIRQRLATGEIREVGYGQELNYESIVALQPDVLFLYGVDGSSSSRARKLNELGIQVVYCAEYLEDHPLGKAEWIRFFAAFFGKDVEAGQLFLEVDTAYCTLQQLARNAPGSPWVLTGFPWKDTWYVAGGRSFAARMIRDAGASYLWGDDPSSEAIALDLESVYARALEAEVWINAGAAASLEEIRNFEVRFSDLPVMKEGEVYNNNLRMGPGGGNDYWESATVRPDLVLADLIRIFHPGLLPESEYTYYRKLK